MSRLLVTACSQRKRPDEGRLPAIERYDGPAFRVVRRFLRTHPAEPISVYILSARYGLIGQMETIPEYDQRMTAERARELAPGVVAALEQFVGTPPCSKMLLCVGRTYLPALVGYEKAIAPTTMVRVSEGSLGRRLAELYDWLYGTAAEPSFRAAQMDLRRAVQIRGRQVTKSSGDVLDTARLGLAAGTPGVVRFHSWCVLVDGRHVAPKWLVGQLTGLPVSEFTTDDARRVLAQWGVEVQRR